MDWVNIIGLAMGFLGAVIAASGLLVTDRHAIDASVTRLAGDTDKENLKPPAMRDRLTQRGRTIAGLALIALGFQLVAAWLG